MDSYNILPSFGNKCKKLDVKPIKIEVDIKTKIKKYRNMDTILRII